MLYRPYPKSKIQWDRTPELVLVSPIAFQNLSDKFDLPDGKEENINLALYTSAMEEVAAQNNVPFLDVYSVSKKWFESGDQLTIDGSQLTDGGYEKFSKYLTNKIFGGTTQNAETHRELVHQAVNEKNWFWHNDFKIPNGVHVFGRRYDPFGPDNYPFEIAKIREMTAIRDTAIWKATQGEKFDLAAADKNTSPLPPVETNFDPKDKKSRTQISLW